jgi:hypothetical protein
MQRTFSWLTLLLVLVAVPVCVRAYVFYRDLKVGDAGEDVRTLQQILNSRPQTRVAGEGLGAPGQETSYFGEKTKLAVARYQDLFARDILIPLGLLAGTGYVGFSTRALLSGEAQMDQPTAVQSSGLFGGGVPAGAASKPMILSVSPVSGADGTEVTLYGEGFSTVGNRIHAGSGILEDVPSPDGKTLSFTVHDPFPDDLKYPPFLQGKFPDFQYGFIVENENGDSNPVEFTLLNTKINQQQQ